MHKQCHIAIFTHLGNGHVYPVLPLCSELVKRNYRVTYATSEHYVAQVREAGAEPVVFKNRPLNPELEESFRRTAALPTDDDRWWPTIASLQAHFIELTIDIVQQVHDFYEANVPDLVLYDRFLAAGRVLAAQYRIPAVQMSGHFASYGNSIVRAGGTFLRPEPMLGAIDRLDEFLSSCGIATRNNFWHTEKLNIHFIPREFQFCSEHFDSRFCFVGPMLNRRFRPVWKDLSNGKPIILVSGLSALHDVKMHSSGHFRVFVDALADSQCHCILSVGPRTSEELGKLPPNFEINQHASHLEILPRVALSVGHGGTGSTLEAIYHGVPVIVVPPDPSCDEVAYRVVELGLGTRLSKDTLTLDSVRAAVCRTMEDRALKKRLKAFQVVCKESGREILAADRIEEFLRET